ncbi:MAG: hypothetical protein S0880_26590 [Actinomycetota bacterium]|nr:hypothetical protein [Actinomycetota bacterium]
MNSLLVSGPTRAQELMRFVTALVISSVVTLLGTVPLLMIALDNQTAV